MRQGLYQGMNSFQAQFLWNSYAIYENQKLENDHLETKLSYIHHVGTIVYLN